MLGEVTEEVFRREARHNRYTGLKTIYNQNLTALREAVATLPEDIRSQLAGKIEVMDCSHQALLREFGAKP